MSLFRSLFLGFTLVLFLSSGQSGHQIVRHGQKTNQFHSEADTCDGDIGQQQIEHCGEGIDQYGYEHKADQYDHKIDKSKTGLDNVWIAKIFSNVMWNFAANSSLNSECANQGLLYRQHLENNTHWAIRMLDSSLITPSGLIAGDNTQFGHPDECIHTQIPVRNFYPKYCLPTARYAPYRTLYPEYYGQSLYDWPPYDMEKNIWDFIRPRDHFIRYTRDSFRWGLCLPASCTAQDIQTSLNETLALTFAQHGIHFEVNLTDKDCYTAAEMESKHLPFVGRVLMWLWIVLILLALIGTTLEYQLKLKQNQSGPPSVANDSKSSRIKSFLLIFSFIRNTESLCRIGGNDIPIIDGGKGLSIILSILFHRFVLSLDQVGNLEYVEQVLHNPNFFWITGSTNLLDCFFFSAGFLLAWGIIQKINRNRTVNFLNIIINRALRLYPMYLVVIALNIWVLPYVGEGPLWKSYSTTESDICRQNWWLNILFLSTMVDSKEVCICSSWYLSTDFQCYLISVGLIYWVTRSSSWRPHILVGALVVAYAVPSLVIYFQKDVSLWMMSINELKEQDRIPNGYFRRMYFKFYIRGPPYIFGVCVAYLTDWMLRQKLSFPQVVRSNFFLACLFLTLGVNYVGSLFYLPGHEYNVWEHVRYAVPHRLVIPFFFALGYMIDITGKSDLISGIFCSPYLVVLGRISYHIYLLNYNVLISLDVNVRQTSNYTNMYMFWLQVFGDIAVACLVSFFTTLLLEPPMDKLRKKLLPP